MAKSSKLEDYWRQHNIEGLFKELTHMLVQRMPSDPANALVQLLQKKFPKSFKTSTDTANNMDLISKTMTNNLQLQSMTSPRSDFNIENTNDVNIQRRLSNQSQVSNIITIPTVGSAFTDLFKQDTSNSKQAPELSLKNLVFANRFTQQAVKMGKDVRSDRDILEEELIKPMKSKSDISSAANASPYSVSEDLQHAETHEQPSVQQLIKYKQHIHTENDRRKHRQKLAAFAIGGTNTEHMLPSGLPAQSIEGQQQQKSDQDGILSQVIPTSNTTKVPYQPIAKSKEEEEILNDENVFHPKRQRHKERQRNKTSTSRSNTPHIGGRERRVSMRREDANKVPMMQFSICKVCKNIITNEGDQTVSYSQQVSAEPTARSFEPPQSNRSVETASGDVDDWFESASDVSGPRQVLPWTPDDVKPSSTTSNIFQRSIFQPIKDYNTVNMKNRSPTVPFIFTDDDLAANRSTVSRSPASDVFVRTPEPKIRRPSSSRSNPSPVTIGQQLSKAMAHPSALRQVPESTLTTTILPTTDRRMSDWSTREQSPYGSDEN